MNWHFLRLPRVVILVVAPVAALVAALAGCSGSRSGTEDLTGASTSSGGTVGAIGLSGSSSGSIAGSSSTLMGGTSGAASPGGATSSSGASAGNGGDSGTSVDGGGANTAGTASTGGMGPDAGGTSAGGAELGEAGSGTAGVAGASGSGGSNGSGDALIKNDVFWTDTSGDLIYSQGGGVLTVGDTYYWYGVHYEGAESYAANPSNQNSNTNFVAITTYSSKDLANWKFEGNALTYASIAATLSMSASTWIGRVGATYNATTKKYVIVGQYQGTPDTQQFFATSDMPNGAFVVDHAQPTIPNVVNNNCGDQSVFTDDDGAAYVLCSSLSGRSNTYIVPLRPSDFLEAMAATKIFGGAGREGNAMFKVDGRYYVCSSDLHGWNSSHTYCISATDILGPYAAEEVMGNTDRDFSHVTQTGLFITVKGSSQDTVIFGGDRWSDFAGNGVGFNQWMPLTFDGTSPVMQSVSEWWIDAATGAWGVGPGNNYALNPSFEADRVATNPPTGWTTSGGADVTSTRSGNFAWQLSEASSIEQALSGLPNGNYTLSVWAKGTATGTLSVTGFGATDLSVPLSGGSGFTQVTLSGIAVGNGEIHIGAATSSGTVTLDDFTLLKD